MPQIMNPDVAETSATSGRAECGAVERAHLGWHGPQQLAVLPSAGALSRPERISRCRSGMGREVPGADEFSRGRRSYQY
jgi:hypothetical protein